MKSSNHENMELRNCGNMGMRKCGDEFESQVRVQERVMIIPPSNSKLKLESPILTRYSNFLATLVVCIFAYFHTSTFAYCADGAAPVLDQATVDAGAAFSRRVAAESMVLLKNRDNALPLAPGSKVAIFDRTGTYRSGGGGSSEVKAVRIVDIPTGLAEAGFTVDPESRDTAVMIVERASSEGRENSPKWFGLHSDFNTLKEIKQAGFKKIVVVFNSGHVINLDPLERDPAVSAILWTWYPGGEGGAAVGDILAGKVNPSGRLASTFARAVSDWPSDGGFLDYRGVVPYEDDIFVGYRYFETIPGAKDKVVYPFGYGLSYTTWDVKNEAFRMKNGECAVRVTVTNTGLVAGKRSVLCYTSLKGGKAQHPAIELRAYAKTRLLEPGESEELTLSFAKRDLAFFDEDGVSGKPGSWVIDQGEYTVLVGGSVREVTPAGIFTVAAPEVLETPGFKLKADTLARRLNADGTYTTLPVTYQTRPGNLDKINVRKEPMEKPAIMLYDVADGKATMDEFLGQMTIEEMLSLCYGHPRQDPNGTGSIGALAKFGISAAQTCDGPAGVRRSIKSTYFPCAALLASAFDPALMREVGVALGRESAETDFDILLAPGLCIHRHPLCGRNFEYFSEDPLVSGVSATEYVKGVQSCGVGATIKHFAGNNRESMRQFEKDIVGERAFREIYLRGFERAVKEANPWAVMSAYSGLNGYNSSEHYGMLTGILRGEWGFDGIVMSDWHTSVPLWREVAAGNDVKMNTDRNMFERRHAKEGFGVNEGASAADANFLMVQSVRDSARRVCEMVMKTRRFARERAAR